MSAVQQQTASAPALILNPENAEERALMVDERKFASAQRKAAIIAASGELIPAAYQNNVGATMIALNMAARMNCEPLQVMQSLYIVHGKPAFSSSFLIAQINASDVIDGALRFEETETTCRAYGTKAGERIDGPMITMDMANAEGWTTRNGSKWKTMPALMLRYRAAAFWARTNAPHLSMGLQTSEELSDVGERDITPAGVQVLSGAQALLDDEPDKIQKTASQPAETTPETTAGGESETAEPETWPRLVDNQWLDSAGEIYDPDSHGWSKANNAPSVKTDGTFRAARTTKTAAEENSEELAPGMAFDTTPPANPAPHLISDEIEAELLGSSPVLATVKGHIENAANNADLDAIREKTDFMISGDDEQALIAQWIAARRSQLTSG